MYHTPVLLEASVEGLKIKPEGVYVDVTFGGGGHTKEILRKLGVDGRLIAFDQDDEAGRNTLDNPRFTLIKANFKFLKRYLRLYGIGEIDGLLADLGVSSHQFDTPGRGFSFRGDGPLDMRMDSAQELTAAEILNNYPEADLVEMFSRYGEVRNARTLARELVLRRNHAKYGRISDLMQVLDKFSYARSNKYLAQVFQALRIEVNDELGSLQSLLEQSLEVLKPGGRLVVISYHSIEDRLVKRFMKTGNFSGEIIKDDFGKAYRPFKLIAKKPIVPTEKELVENPRSRSAKLRIAEKT